MSRAAWVLLLAVGCGDPTTEYYDVRCTKTSTGVGIASGGNGGGVAIVSVCVREDSVLIVPDDTMQTAISRMVRERNLRRLH